MPRQKGTSSLDSVKDARKDLTKAYKKAKREIFIDLEIMADQVYGRAYELTPEKTGTLIASLEVRTSRDKQRPGILASAYAVDPVTNEEYATIQHEEYPAKTKPGASMYYLAIPLDEAAKKFLEMAELEFDTAFEFEG